MAGQRCEKCGKKICFYVTADGSSVVIDDCGLVTIMDFCGKIYKGFVPHWSTCKARE